MDRPGIRALLERHAASDPDTGVALLALDRLRQQDARDLGKIFEKRLALAHSVNDEKALAVLTAEHQHGVCGARRRACRPFSNCRRPSSPLPRKPAFA